MRSIRVVVATVALFACVTLAFAQNRVAGGSGSAGKAAVSPRVVLTLKDGKTVSGEFIEVTPAGMTLKPNAKAEPIFTPWSAIKTAGNKMTHDGVVAEWRKTKRELLCDTCEGGGATTCPTCAGTSVDPAQKQPCEKCESTGSLGKCKTSNCVEGKIPCPNTCLKPEMFTGNPDPADGKRKKIFRGKGGSTHWWSEGHVGELIVFEDGQPVNKGVCPKCEGKSRIADPACKGTAKQICTTCKGHGIVGPDCTACPDGNVACATCTGTGLKPIATPADPAATPAQ